MSSRLLVSASKSVASSLRNNAASSVRISHPSSSSSRFFSSEEASPSDVLTVGTVKAFYFKTQFGFIIPDGVGDNPDEKDLVFIHRNDIKTKEYEGGEKFFPGLQPKQRVQFKTVPAEKGITNLKALDLTLEGGELVPPFQPGYLERFMKAQKARFGDEVFAIMDSVTDQQEMETKIVEAFEKCKSNIERQKVKIERASELTGSET